MKHLRWSFSFMLMLLLGACSSNFFKFPWQSQQPNQDVRPKISKPTSIIPSKSAPRQVPLETSNLPLATDDDLEKCRNRLGLPAEIDAMADSTNFGDRHAVDQWGRPLVASPQIIVLHETVLDEEATINLFQTPHPNDNDQVSYHMLVGLDGSRLRIVPDEKRAFGAGMSAFGDVTQRTKLGSVGSINNIALHISLVTPADGRGNTPAHSGYTDAQYKTLAEQVLLWQAKFGIPFTRLTTHAAVDRSRSRYDPRSFRWDFFQPHYKGAATTCGFTYLDNQEAGL